MANSRQYLLQQAQILTYAAVLYWLYWGLASGWKTEEIGREQQALSEGAVACRGELGRQYTPHLWERNSALSCLVR